MNAEKTLHLIVVAKYFAQPRHFMIVSLDQPEKNMLDTIERWFHQKALFGLPKDGPIMRTHQELYEKLDFGLMTEEEAIRQTQEYAVKENGIVFLWLSFEAIPPTKNPSQD